MIYYRNDVHAMRAVACPRGKKHTRYTRDAVVRRRGLNGDAAASASIESVETREPPLQSPLIFRAGISGNYL